MKVETVIHCGTRRAGLEILRELDSIAEAEVVFSAKVWLAVLRYDINRADVVGERLNRLAPSTSVAWDI